jgi:hypothetical protein
MTMPNYIESKDGTERTRVRRAIERIGPARVAKILNVSRATATGYAAGAPVMYATEMLMLANLPDLEREAERAR